MDKNFYVLLSTVFRGDNYGSTLQAYALKRYIEMSFNFRCYIVERKYTAVELRQKRIRMLIKCLRSRTLFQEVMSKHFNKKRNLRQFSATTSLCFTRFIESKLEPRTLLWSELKKLAESVNCVKCVCGSDQIWNPSGAGLNDLNFLLYSPFEKNISYAASMGTDVIPHYNKAEFMRKVDHIANISVREVSAAEVISNQCKKCCQVVVDPVLLVGREFWEKFMTNKNFPREYVFCYFLNKPSITAKWEVKKYTEQGELVFVLSRERCFSEKVEYIDNVDPLDFVKIISNAKTVLTDSYHGMLFSLLFNRNFYIFQRDYENNVPQPKRIIDLLNNLGIIDRYIREFDIEKISCLKGIVYESVNLKLEEMRRNSRLFLEKSLES